MQGAYPTGWIVPNWPAPDHVRAAFTGRGGGASLPPWDSLNLGLQVGDAAAQVALNRQRVCQALGVSAYFMQQVHGCAVLDLTGSALSAAPTADACLTREPGVACCIQVADCLPVLLTDRRGRWVAAAHAGWRGLAGWPDPGQGGVLDALFKQIMAQALPGWTFNATEIIAWLGPCIGPQAFEVGPEVKAAFEAGAADAGQFFKPVADKTEKWLADLAGLARSRLQALGVREIHGNDASAAWCTVGNPLAFFSHRRDSVRLGGSGRHGAFIWLV